MFEQAVRSKLRFNYKGLCSVEDLWDLSLKDLKKIFSELNNELKSLYSDEEALFGDDVKIDNELQLKVDVVKHIVKTKLLEQKEKEAALAKADLKKKLLAIKAEKQEAGLRDLPVEDLDRMIDEL